MAELAPLLTDADREKRRVALGSLFAALLLTVLKLAVGLATNSLGVLSEAAHSGLDLVAAGITLWAVRVSGRPPDADHPYGHGKFENLSALFETLLLLATCGWIVWEAVERLTSRHPAAVDANVWAFLVIIVAIVVDVTRSRALLRVARKYQSQALEADALHFSTDVWSSGVVLVGLACVALADRLGLAWLAWADSVAALAVSGIVIWVSLRLGKRSIDELLDRAPGELRQAVQTAAAGVPGVEDVGQVRIRRSGPQVFADVTLAVDPAAGLEGSHAIASAVEESVRHVAPEADVVVHVEPAGPASHDAAATVRVLAARWGLVAHSICIYDQDDGRFLELHLEVDESLNLEQAHARVCEFEAAVREALPEVNRLVSHLEPAGRHATAGHDDPAGKARVRQALNEFLAAEQPSVHPHDLEVQRQGQDLHVSFHCVLDAATPIADAHSFTEALEQHLRQRIPNLVRVVIQVEPASPDA